MDRKSLDEIKALAPSAWYYPGSKAPETNDKRQATSDVLAMLNYIEYLELELKACKDELGELDDND